MFVMKGFSFIEFVSPALINIVLFPFMLILGVCVLVERLQGLSAGKPVNKPV